MIKKNIKFQRENIKFYWGIMVLFWLAFISSSLYFYPKSAWNLLLFFAALVPAWKISKLTKKDFRKLDHLSKLAERIEKNKSEIDSLKSKADNHKETIVSKQQENEALLDVISENKEFIKSMMPKD